MEMGRRLGVLAALLLVFFSSLAAFAAVGTLDQTGVGTNTSFNADTATLIWQQQIQVGLTGPLAGISVTATGKTSTQFTLRVRSGSAPSTQPVLFQQLVTVTATMAAETVFVDMTASGITFTAGNMFVMEIQGNGTGANIIGAYVAPPGTPGYPQPLYRNGSAYAAGFTLAFQTYVITCPTGASCDDGNPCTTNDTCNASYVCVGTPVVCTASDQCHAAGTCDVGTGQCSNPPQPDTTACNDSNACTQTDTCQAGTCVGSNPVVCTASDTCHVAGLCNPASGMCSNPPKLDGMSCTDSNKCDTAPTCMGGVCAGPPVVCAPPDACHQAGSCAPASGSCSYLASTDGTSCPGGECKGGACLPADAGMTDGGGGAADGGDAADGGSATDGGSAADGGSHAEGGGAGEAGGASEGGSGGASDGGGAPEGGSATGGGDGGSAAGAGGSSGGSAGSSGGGGPAGGGGSTGGTGAAGGGAVPGDAGIDARGRAPADSGGCGCVIANRAPSGAWVGLGVAIALALRRRRRTGR
jgi:hypothetical protein